MILLLKNYRQNQISCLKGDIKIYHLYINQIYQDLVYINYLIPNKNLLLQNLPSTFNKSFLLLIDLFSYLYEIFLVIFIFGSSFTALVLIIGSFYRLFRISKRKSKQIIYK